jgi:predicted TIM-barrel enzyme
MGLTIKGTIGAHTAMSLDAAIPRVQAICDAAKSTRSDVIVLCHGGPIAEPDDVRYVLDRTQSVAGFFGASSVERLPTERAITAQVREFKEIAPTSIDEVGARV